MERPPIVYIDELTLIHDVEGFYHMTQMNILHILIATREQDEITITMNRIRRQSTHPCIKSFWRLLWNVGLTLKVLSFFLTEGEKIAKVG